MRKNSTAIPRPIKEIEYVVKNLLLKKNPDSTSLVNSTEHLRKK